MKPTNLDITLYDAGALTICNNLIDGGYLNWMPDEEAVAALTWYLIIEAIKQDPAYKYSYAAMQSFIYHAQKAGKLSGVFLEASFDSKAKNYIPSAVPVAPANLYLVDAGGGMVSASSDLGQNCDRWELQQLQGGAWEKVTDGVVGEAGVDYIDAPGPGTHEYRVVGRQGFVPGFPGTPESVVVE